MYLCRTNGKQKLKKYVIIHELRNRCIDNDESIVIHNSYNNAGGFQTPTTTAVMVGRVPNIISHNN